MAKTNNPKRAAKRAANTRRKNKQSRIAKKAKAAGTSAEEAYVHRYLKKKYTVRHGAGIPDYINLEKRGWEYLEIKPSTGARRILNENQLKMFPELIKKGERVYMIYYTRKKISGSKAKPKYSFKFEKILLKMKHFKSREGPNPDNLLD